ncbi:hypothetical protein [Streptomyces sp. NPDC101455]|uniref:hypothetical protein n=1 Tax=Streptomyces sp. NPDC101455 TaxID=3366142 RepID=UPI0038101365
MARIPYAHTDETGFTTHGYFESDTAERFHGNDPDPDGYNLAEELYCSDLGYWLLDRGQSDGSYVAISDEEARQWLIDNEYPEEAKRRFERPKGGRPSKGEKVEVRIPAWTLRRIDEIAARNDLDQLETIRRLLVMAVRTERSIAESAIIVPRQ